MSIQLTETAARHIRKSIVEKRGGLALRLGVRQVGCGGLAYTFDGARELSDQDRLFEAHDAKVVVAEEALPFLDGATLDFVRDGFKETFRVDNPNAKSTCGCGESFGV
ncbi:MAG: iron-sulfur cluster assembly accessory protein [Betaproteobacteria bacterium]|nr:iron-sulfur cluster assembly accessory protein [Betaproteobacteria bacterium]